MHLVEKGHTLYSIAKVYDVSVDEIIFANPEAKNGIKIDEVLRFH